MRQGVSLSPRDQGLTAKPLSVDAPTPTRIMDAKQFPRCLHSIAMRGRF